MDGGDGHGGDRRGCTGPSQLIAKQGLKKSPEMDAFGQALLEIFPSSAFTSAWVLFHCEMCQFKKYVLPQ